MIGTIGAAIGEWIASDRFFGADRYQTCHRFDRESPQLNGTASTRGVLP